MQPKKNDCTEKNLHTFIDKAFSEAHNSKATTKPATAKKPTADEAI